MPGSVIRPVGAWTCHKVGWCLDLSQGVLVPGSVIRRVDAWMVGPGEVTEGSRAGKCRGPTELSYRNSH